jgi:anti-sigma regulatory factor (Ser/Thr protein kinase)
VELVPADPRADGPAQARDYVSAAFRAAGYSEQQIGDASLMVSELVTNGIRHAERPPSDLIGIVVSSLPAFMRVEVSDRGGGGAAILEQTTGRIGGWGLVLVDRLSDRWGTISGPPHVVWFELDR